MNQKKEILKKVKREGYFNIPISKDNKPSYFFKCLGAFIIGAILVTIPWFLMFLEVDRMHKDCQYEKEQIEKVRPLRQVNCPAPVSEKGREERLPKEGEESSTSPDEDGVADLPEPYTKPEEPYTEVYAKITAYNTVEAQTDSTPCISAYEINICGMTDVVACPPQYDVGTKVEIAGKTYYCRDKMGSICLERDERGKCIKIGPPPNGFDISFDKDMRGAREWGLKWIKIKVYEL